MGDKDNIGQILLGLDIDKAGFSKKLSGLAGRAKSMVTSAFKPVGGMIGGALAVGSVIAFTKSCLDLGSNLSEVQNVVDTTFNNMTGRVNEFAQTAIDKFGLSETVAKKMMGTYGAMSKSFGFNPQEVYDMSSAITGLTADVSSFYNLSTDEAYTKMKSIWTGETEALKELGVVMTQTALDQYALNNGFGKTTVAMTEQEKVLLRYRFVQSQLSAAAGDFARTSEGWANQTRVLSLRLDQLKATLGQGFINLFTPLLKIFNTFIAKVQSAANAFLKLTEIITGKKQTGFSGAADAADSASDSVDGVADSASNAAKQAAKAARALMGFDQMQKIGDSASSGSSDSSGSTSAGTGAIAQELNMATEAATALEEKLVGMVAKLKSAWETGDFTEIGSMIAKKINSGLLTIDWTEIQASTKKISTSIATFFNGFIQSTDWTLVGGTIAQGINTGVLGINTFLKTFDWSNAAKAVANTINGFLKKTDWKELGSTIGNAIDALQTTIINFCKTLDWLSVGKAIIDVLGGALKEVDLGDTATIVLTLFAGHVVKNATTALFSSASTKIAETLGAALKNNGGWSGVGKLVVEKIGDAAGKVNVAAGKFFDTMWTTIRTTMHIDVKSIFASGNMTTIGTAIFGGVVGAIGAAFAGWKLGQWLYDQNFFGLSDSLDKIVFSIADFVTITIPEALKKTGNNIVSLVAEIKGKVHETFTKMKASWDSLKDKTKEMIAEGKAKGRDLLISMKTSWDGIKAKTKNLIAKGKSTGKSALDTVRKAWDSISEKTKTLKVAFNDTFTAPLKKAWNALAKKINDGITGLNKILPKDLEIKVKVPTFATGGFPEEGPFMMNRGEIAGKFSNGKTVVANNKQITDGIANSVGPAVYGAVKSAMAITLPLIHTPALASITGSGTDRTMQQLLDAVMMLASGGVNSEVVTILKELLELIKSSDSNVYIDGEKVTKIITDIINKHTDITGVCEIKT